MPVYAGATAPSAFKVGSADCSAIYAGSTLVWSAAVAPTTQAYYSDTFSSTLSPVWKKAGANGTVTIVSGKMVINPGTTAAYTGGVGVLLGDPANLGGNSTTGAPAAISDIDMTFDVTLVNLLEQYPAITLGARTADLWVGGAGDGSPKSGSMIILEPGANGGQIEFQNGYAAGTTTGTTPFTFPGTSFTMRIVATGKRLQIRAWTVGGTQPTTWGYDNANHIIDQSDGFVLFTASNGGQTGTGNQQAKTFSIDNFVSTVPIRQLGTAVAAPTTDPAGFTRLMTENFDTAAAAGTGAGQFMTVYANSFQPYDEASPYFPRAMNSAHDGVLDITLDGTRGSAGSFGSPSNYFNRLGGRFAMRAKAIGGIGNGPAFMLWPSSGVWADGEVDFPESVSSSGGQYGFQDSPWIHQHSMVVGSEANAQDVNLGVSWRDWHVYAVEWKPGTSANVGGSLKYYVDDVLVYTSTTDIPFTTHRFMYQVGNYGGAGHLYIDWVTISTLS